MFLTGQKQTIKKWCQMTDQNSADQLLRSAAHNVVEDFLRRAKAIPHAGERGTAREDVVRSFLGDFLPKRCGVGTGFVMDAMRAVSKQIDVVLYDRVVGTMLTIREGTGLFPVETVCGVGEVKSDLSKDELIDSLEKLKSVKTLDKTGNGSNWRIIGGGMASGKLDYSQYHDRTFGFVFGWSSLSRDTIADRVIEWCSKEPRSNWPNFICVPNKGFYFWKTTNYELDYNALDATHFSYTDTLEEDQVILMFLAQCSNAFSSAHVASVPLHLYIEHIPFAPLLIEVTSLGPG